MHHAVLRFHSEDRQRTGPQGLSLAEVKWSAQLMIPDSSDCPVRSNRLGLWDGCQQTGDTDIAILLQKGWSDDETRSHCELFDCSIRTLWTLDTGWTRLCRCSTGQSRNEKRDKETKETQGESGRSHDLLACQKGLACILSQPSPVPDHPR